jgi:S-adenosylmethionine:tRNA ribosyltransferase-isomerase
LVAPYASGARLLLARLTAAGHGTTDDYLASYGEPIRYGYVRERWPLEAYQNVYAQLPGSAEMPSAGRPVTERLLTRLAANGILLAPILLHTGVSSPERHEGPYPEYYEVPVETAQLANAVRSWGGRVVAVGTTVVRALETTAERFDGALRGGSGWTGLRITPERGLRVVDGLITGWHEPEASHLELLEAAAGRATLERCYAEALRNGYLWHEFGDSHLILTR